MLPDRNWQFVGALIQLDISTPRIILPLQSQLVSLSVFSMSKQEAFGSPPTPNSHASSKRVAFRRVGLFVDWNTQILAAPAELEDDPVGKCRFALLRVGKLATKHLCDTYPGDLFRVRLRLYHGWTAGTTQTPNRRAFAKIPEAMQPDDIFPSSRVLAAGDIEFGDRLIDALAKREQSGSRIHLPNTLRKQQGGRKPVEKMVDTALATDLLSWARTEPDSIALVFSADDDMVPPVFTAEAWMVPFGGAVRLQRPDGRGDSRYLALEGLID